MLVLFLFLQCVLYVHGIATHESALFPESLPSPPAVRADGRQVPRRVWIAIKDRGDELPSHLRGFFARNPQWDVTLCDNRCKDEFMERVFRDTAVLWAYQAVSDKIYAAKADIWRYCVLYVYGGMYMDDDSDIQTPLDEILSPADSLVMTEEGSSSLGDCYDADFPLSDYSALSLFRNQSLAPHYSGQKTVPTPRVLKEMYGNEVSLPVFFHDHTLVNWGLFAKPRHPLFAHALAFIVYIVKTHYLRTPAVAMRRWDPRWKLVMCSTGFTLTYTLRLLELELTQRTHAAHIAEKQSIESVTASFVSAHLRYTPPRTPFDCEHLDSANTTTPAMSLRAMCASEVPRILQNNFREYRGNVKAFSTGNDPSHYMKFMNKHKQLSLLHTHAPHNLSRILDHLHDKTVMGDAGKSIFWIFDSKKHTFLNYEVFLQSGFADAETRHVSDSLLQQVPDGRVVASAEEAKEMQRAWKERARAPQKSAAQNVQGNEITGTKYNATRSFLTQLSHTLQSLPTPIGCWSDDYTGSRDDYIKGTYEQYLNGTPVLLYPFCAKTFQLGNTLGYYLNDLACASLSGAHFLTVTQRFSYIDVNALSVKSERERNTFFEALPQMWVNPEPDTQPTVRARMKKECDCLQYCWENSRAPWLRALLLIESALNPAIDAYLQITNALSVGTTLNLTTDSLSTSPHTQSSQNALSQPGPLPLVPNVTIQYRCGDNIGFGKTRYGLLPFSAFTYKGRIPKDARYIYVIADSPSRQQYHVYSSRCETILGRLFAYLKQHFPLSTVAVKRGGDQFLDYARLARSEVVFCSASTFCLWPALANRHGTVYYPLTPLVAGAWDNNTAPAIKANFHWIEEVEIIKQFKHYRPWTKLIDDLETIGQPPARR